MTKGCHYCGTTEEELRPYGPGGDPLCFACMTAEPEREKEAGKMFEGHIALAESQSPTGTAMVSDGIPPVAVDAEELPGIIVVGHSGVRHEMMKRAGICLECSGDGEFGKTERACYEPEKYPDELEPCEHCKGTGKVDYTELA